MIKKLYIILPALMLLVCVQEADAQMFRGGVHTGITTSQVSQDRAGGFDKLGWFASVYTNRDVGEFSRLQLEIMYIQKGSRHYYDPVHEDNNNPKTLFAFPVEIRNDEFDGPPPYRDYTFRLHYIEVPVFYQLDLSPLVSLQYVERLTAEVGVSLSTVVGHYETNDFGSEYNDERSFRPVEFNLIGGIYYPVTDRLNFHVRYSQGLTPLRPPASAGESQAQWYQLFKRWYDWGQFNTVMTFGLSYTMFYSGN